MFTSFIFNGHHIRFRTSPRLERYTRVVEWDNGYIVVMAKYEGCEEEEECIDLLELKSFVENLLKKDHYISKREYLNQMKQYETIIQHFSVLKNSGMLESYCGKNAMISEKEYLDGILKSIDPAQILVVSFTNKAVNELKEKINKDLDIKCPIATFHSAGNAIIHKNAPEEKLNIVEDSKLYFIVRDYFRSSVMQNENIVNKLILFLRRILMLHLREMT